MVPLKYIVHFSGKHQISIALIIGFNVKIIQLKFKDNAHFKVRFYKTQMHKIFKTNWEMNIKTNLYFLFLEPIDGNPTPIISLDKALISVTVTSNGKFPRNKVLMSLSPI